MNNTIQSHLRSACSPATIVRFVVTPHCNLSCFYCHNEGFDKKKSWAHELSDDSLRKIVQSLKQHGVRSICITGGEPLLHPRFTSLLRIIADAIGAQNTHVSTNGTLLPQYVNLISELKIGRVNVSCDAIDSQLFRRINRSSKERFNDIISGITQLVECGIVVNINVVLLEDHNATPEYLTSILNYWKNKGVRLSFLRLCFASQNSRYDIELLKQMLDNMNLNSVLIKNGNRPPTLCYYLDKMEIALRYYLPNRNIQPCLSCTSRSLCSEGIYHPRLGLNGELHTCILRNDLVLDLTNPQNHSSALDGFLKMYDEVPATWEPATALSP